jgi:hypothetical protein
VQKFGQAVGNVAGQHLASVFRYPHKVVIDIVGCVSGTFDVYRTSVLSWFGVVKLTEE